MPPTRPLRHRIATVLVILVAAVALPGGVAAQDDEPDDRPTTWGISPASELGRDRRSVISHVVEPGETLTEHVVIDNYGEEPITVALYTADARPADGEFDVTAADEPVEGVGAWADATRTDVEIPGRDSAIVPVVIQVPRDATPGDHAGGVLASRRTVGGSDEVGIETERRVGARIYLRVAGAVRTELSVSDLRAGYHQRWHPLGRGRVEVTYRVENTGNLRLDGEVEVRIVGPFGWGERSVAGPPVVDLLPGHRIDRRVVLDEVVPLGRYRVEVVASPTASGTQAIEGTVADGTAEVRIWALPYATAGVALVVLVALAWWWRRRRRSRAAPPAAEVGSEGDAAR